jgi:hypothetical protein
MDHSDESIAVLFEDGALFFYSILGETINAEAHVKAHDPHKRGSIAIRKLDKGYQVATSAGGSEIRLWDVSRRRKDHVSLSRHREWEHRMANQDMENRIDVGFGTCSAVLFVSMVDWMM